MKRKNLAKISVMFVLLLASCGKWLDVTSKSEVDIDDMYDAPRATTIR